MKKTLFLLLVMHGLRFGLFSQNIGIGTTTPAARLHVADSNVVFSATGDIPASTGDVSVSGAGRRMLWYPGKAAFRVGYAAGVNWDKTYIGNYSFAAGYDTRADGGASIAMGQGSVASGSASVAMGFIAIASGTISVAMGRLTTASGDMSTAMGNVTVAGGNSSFAVGSGCQANGNFAVAMGSETIASGNYSTAIGFNVSTNGHLGALVIGDFSNTIMNAASDNSFRARFDNGYRFYTSGDLSSNAYLAAGDNAWSTTSDFRKKENFEEINGEDALKKIAAFHLGTWNYKSQNAKIFRHYGPMAQDFYAAFGKDNYGTIGNDTTINQADFNGVNLIAIEALEKRTEKIKQLEARNKELQQELALLQRKMDERVKDFSKELQELKQLILARQSSTASIK
jgi:Chaperone of endosialidase/Head domain of trimeric autotransporter adhesin